MQRTCSFWCGNSVSFIWIYCSIYCSRWDTSSHKYMLQLHSYTERTVFCRGSPAARVVSSTHDSRQVQLPLWLDRSQSQTAQGGLHCSRYVIINLREVGLISLVCSSVPIIHWNQFGVQKSPYARVAGCLMVGKSWEYVESCLYLEKGWEFLLVLILVGKINSPHYHPQWPKLPCSIGNYRLAPVNVQVYQ